MAALARTAEDSQGTTVAKRFELFVDHMEIANGYYELCDPVEQRRRIQEDNALRQQLGRPVVPPDEQLLAALEHGLPDCAGVAIGGDRLLMIATGQRDIGRVMSFSHKREA